MPSEQADEHPSDHDIQQVVDRRKCPFHKYREEHDLQNIRQYGDGERRAFWIGINHEAFRSLSIIVREQYCHCTRLKS